MEVEINPFFFIETLSAKETESPAVFGEFFSTISSFIIAVLPSYYVSIFMGIKQFCGLTVSELIRLK